MSNLNNSLEIKQLKKDIKSNKIKVLEIEKKTGVDQSQISKILNGQNKRKSENYQKICKFALNNCDFEMDVLKQDLIKKINTLSINQERLTLLAIYGLLSNIS